MRLGQHTHINQIVKGPSKLSSLYKGAIENEGFQQTKEQKSTSCFVKFRNSILCAIIVTVKALAVNLKRILRVHLPEKNRPLSKL